MWQFIRTRYFWVSIAAMAAIVLLLGAIFIMLLGWFTNHGATVTVPNVRFMAFKDASKIIEEAGLNIEIADSVFESEKKPLEVLKQIPGQGMKVKPGRTIYLTVNNTIPPKVKFPDLKDMSLKQAQLVITGLGLKLGKVTMKEDIAKNAVLDVQINGKPLEVGTEIARGSVIDLVVGSGAELDEIPVPDILALRVSDARTILRNSSLTIGAIVADRTVKNDTDDAIIYKQTPENFTTQNNTIKPGESIDIFVTRDTVKVNNKIRLHAQKDNERTKERAGIRPEDSNYKKAQDGE